MSTERMVSKAEETARALGERIEQRTAVVGVVGLGYVGVPACIGLVKAGLPCIGFDVDVAKIEALRAHRSYLKHIPFDELNAAGDAGRFTPTDEFARLSECDAVLITVPTPLDEHKQPDLSYVEATCAKIAACLKPGMLVVLESTSYPGTTKEVVIPILERSGLTCGVDFFVGFSPEREDPGNKDFSTNEIPKVVAGSGAHAGRLVEALYRCTHEHVVPVSSPEVAEATKILENTFRSVNIALVNELKMVYSRMGIDIWEVIEAASTKPFGFMPFYPGPGLGGHCIPIDPFYLSWKAREYDRPTRFIELAGEINHGMPEYVVGSVVRALNKGGLAVRGSRVLVLGLAYKADIDDDRESPAYPIMQLLTDMGAEVSYNDPYIDEVPRKREYAWFEGKRSVPVESGYDLFVLVTPHSQYRSIDFASLGVPIVDTRNMVPSRTPGLVKS